MDKKVCKNCQIDFEVSSRTSRNIFCSKSCSASYNNLGINRHKNIKPKLCPICGNTVAIRANKYCSKDCYLLGYTNYLDKKSLDSKISCTRCMNEFIPVNKSIKYCSTLCSSESKKEQTIESWVADPNTATQKNGGLSYAIRRYLIEKADNSCSRCKWSEVNPTTGVCPLEVDHIDGDSFNNNPENLRVLCPNCHSLTPTYRGLNKGKATRIYYGIKLKK